MSRKKEGPSGHTPSPRGTGVPTSSSLTLPNASTARQHLDSKKKSENKQIHPGYSMFDWNKICNSGKDMSGTKGQLLRVTPEELARHCTDGDMWTSVRGVVYNVTQFGKYHPGGRAQLKRGAGQDCTELFDKIHVWVNSEAILQKCVVGYLVGSSPPKKTSNLNVSVTKPPFTEESGDNHGVDILSLQVPGSGGIDISNVGGSSEGGNMEEDTEELDVTIPMSGISIQSTDVSVPVPSIGGISVPVPITGGIYIPVPITADISFPVPSTCVISISVPSVSNISSTPFNHPNDTKVDHSRHLPSYITDHPLISKTAYETAV